MNYYISDTHLGHNNIMRLCERPFSSVEEQDKTIIENWNNVVGKDDLVIIVGDFCYKSGKSPKEYLEELHGKKMLITGNHDNIIKKNYREYIKYFEDITPYKEINDRGTDIVVFHYPITEWNGFFRDTLLFYGHIHNNIKNDAYNIHKNIKNSYNVGADILNFTPQTKENVIKLNKEFDLKVAKESIFIK